MLGNRWVFVALAVAMVLALFAARGREERHAYATCLATRDCLKDEVCVVTPKDDGFATVGTCTNPCAQQAECLNGWTCVAYVDTGAFVVPPGTRAAKESKGPARMVCAPPVR